MGIRFQCPYCQKKLNVKSFLAGKRGICPYCDRGLQIPLESEAGNGKAPHPTESVEVRTIESDSALAAQFAAEAFAEPLPIGGGAAASSAGPASPAESPAATSSASRSAAETSSAGAASTPGSAKSDPIDENPEAVWYVRPPSGGQFGPAKGDVMRTWLAEGRVSPDALVWREGWADWQEAEPVFPSLSKRSTPPPPPASAAPVAPNSAASAKPAAAAKPVAAAKAVAVATPAPRTVAADPYAGGPAQAAPQLKAATSPSKALARRRSHLPALIAVAALVLISAGLLVGLILVLTGAFNSTG
jgi:hypothetical protein